MNGGMEGREGDQKNVFWFLLFILSIFWVSSSSNLRQRTFSWWWFLSIYSV